MKREILWESQHLDPVEIDTDNQDDSSDTYDDGFKEEKELPRIITTPLGIFQANDKMNPYRQFEFWMGHTNFNIDETAKDILDNTLGVEVLFILSPLRFMVAVGRMFEWKQVRVAIERGLCGKHITDEKIESIHDKDISAKVLKIKEDLVEAYDHWAIYVFPNGEYHFSYSNGENFEDFEEAVNLYKKSEQVSGGILLQSEVTEVLNE